MSAAATEACVFERTRRPLATIFLVEVATYAIIAAATIITVVVAAAATLASADTVVARSAS